MAPPDPVPDRSVVHTNWARSALDAGFRHAGLTDCRVVLPGFICEESFSVFFDRLGVTPSFVDIDPDTYVLDIEAAKEKLGDADGLVLVHPFGYPADLAAWSEVAEAFDAVLVEDCARALGATRDGRVVGTAGTAAVYSWHKVAPAAYGGALVTDSPAAAASLGEPTYDARAVYHVLPDSLHDSLSVEYPRQYEPRRLDDITRRRIERYLADGFSEEWSRCEHTYDRLSGALSAAGFRVQADRPGRARFGLAARVPDGVDRESLLWYLYERVDPSPAKPVWANPWAKSVEMAELSDRYPNTAELADSIVYFPLFGRSMDTVAATIDGVDGYLDAFA